jgi:hypothetical protein
MGAELCRRSDTDSAVNATERSGVLSKSVGYVAAMVRVLSSWIELGLRGNTNYRREPFDSGVVAVAGPLRYSIHERSKYVSCELAIWRKK